jgi:YbgC/YbaW family acyl-CoA thioester hydrolase
MTSSRAGFRHVERLRVRWAEVDAQRIVFNGHYLMYLDTAVAGYWRAMALPYEATLAHFGGDLYVKKATLEYHASARYDETLDIGIRCERIGRSSMALRGAVWRGESLLVEGELLYVFAVPQSQTSRPLPEPLRALIEGYEAGAPVFELRCGDWAALGADASALREAVFVQEQGIAASLVWDEADACALHAVARNRLGLPLAAARLVAVAPGVAKLGRMAANPLLRGAGAGRAVLDALLAAARERGDSEVMLHAQASAVGFYARHGFAARGAPFQEAGIEHREMFRSP